MVAGSIAPRPGLPGRGAMLIGGALTRMRNIFGSVHSRGGGCPFSLRFLLSLEGPAKLRATEGYKEMRNIADAAPLSRYAIVSQFRVNRVFSCPLIPCRSTSDARYGYSLHR